MRNLVISTYVHPLVPCEMHTLVPSKIYQLVPRSHIKTLTNVFKSMPQRILWKSDIERIDDLPPNVKLASWLPQQDVLGSYLPDEFIDNGKSLLN